jgi:hypothetical protein
MTTTEREEAIQNKEFWDHAGEHVARQQRRFCRQGCRRRSRQRVDLQPARIPGTNLRRIQRGVLQSVRLLPSNAHGGVAVNGLLIMFNGADHQESKTWCDTHLILTANEQVRIVEIRDDSTHCYCKATITVFNPDYQI